jgi:hypothetical protein
MYLATPEEGEVMWPKCTQHHASEVNTAVDPQYKGKFKVAGGRLRNHTHRLQYVGTPSMLGDYTV